MAVWRRLSLIMVAVLALGVIAAGCGDDAVGSGDATTTEAAPTTTEAPPATTEAATTDEATTDEATTEEPGSDDVAEGLTFFQGSCTGCHAGDGTEGGGIGPRLSGKSLTEDGIRDKVVHGDGAMPGGLASGEDLENVTAYVVSLQ